MINKTNVKVEHGTHKSLAPKNERRSSKDLMAVVPVSGVEQVVDEELVEGEVEVLLQEQ